MKYFSCTDAPIEIYGVEVIDPEQRIFWRLPDEESALVIIEMPTDGANDCTIRT